MNAQLDTLKYRGGIDDGYSLGGSTGIFFGSVTIATFSQLFENFNSVTPPQLPSGWISEETNIDTIYWLTNATFPKSFPNSMSIRASPSGMNDWLFSPAFIVGSGESYDLKFW